MLNCSVLRIISVYLALLEFFMLSMLDKKHFGIMLKVHYDLLLQYFCSIISRNTVNQLCMGVHVSP
jgi:hypothetical protein